MASFTENKQGVKVLIAGSILQLFLGIIYVWSVFVQPISVVYQWSEVSVKLTASYMIAFFVVGILIGGKMLRKMCASKVVLTGGLMLAFGMFATAFVPYGAPWLIYVTYGVFAGFGCGAGYAASLTTAQKWFPNHRGLATGISVGAFGFSVVIFAPLITTFIELFGLRLTLMLLAAIFLATTLILFRMIILPGATAFPTSTAPAKKQYQTSEMIKTRTFYFVALSLMLSTAAYFVVNPAIIAYGERRGIDAIAFGTLFVMITGVSNTLGRVIVPFVTDKVGRERTTIIINIITMVCAILLIFAEGPLFVLAVALITFSFGGVLGVYPVITADYFGMEHVGSNYGAVMGGFAVSAIVFPMILTPIDNLVFKFIALSVLSAGGVLFVLPLLKRAMQEKSENAA
jgi:OFA family oxalate/formate antiporter-like MFS transporter